MTIYILDNDPKECAKALDDKSLDKMIKSISNVLLNVTGVPDAYPFIFFLSKTTKYQEKLSQWARECVSNYKYLVELGQQGCLELNYRHEGLTEYQINIEKILLWLSNNVPDLGRSADQPITVSPHDLSLIGGITPLPLVVPKQYKLDGTRLKFPNTISTVREIDFDYIVTSYRNYYKAKVNKKFATWSRRNPPDWLPLGTIIQF